MDWDEWIAKNRHALEADGTPFELRFVQEILREVPNLSPGIVSVQTPFKDLDGRPRRIDFTIEEGEFVRIALEVDGWDKTGTGTGMSRSEFNDWSHRELSMTAAGWTCMRFANGLIMSKPATLRQSIELNLKMRRGVEGAVRSSSEMAKKTEEKSRELREVAEAAANGDHGALKKLEQMQAQRREIGRSFLSANERKRLDELEKELENERVLRKQAEGENRGMKVMALAFSVVLLVGIAAFVLMRGDDATTSDATTSDSLCAEAVAVGQMDALREGEIVAVKGEVVGAREVGGNFFLNLGDDYPNQDMTIVIWEQDVANWTTPPDAKYDHRVVAVTGELESYQGTPQVVANSPNDVTVCT